MDSSVAMGDALVVAARRTRLFDGAISAAWLSGLAPCRHRRLADRQAVLSITEVLPDPHYQPMKRVRELASRAGFRERQAFNGLLAYTIDFVRIDPSS